MFFFETFFMRNDKEIAKRLRKVVDDKGYSRNEFAELCNVSGPNMSGYLNGQRSLGIKLIDKIKEVIPDLDINWLLYGENTKTEHLVSEPIAEYSNDINIDLAIKKLIDIKTKNLIDKINTMEDQFTKDILEIKCKLEIENEDSELIQKLKRIIEKDTH